MMLQSENCTIYGKILGFICPRCLAYVHCERYRKIVTATGSKDQESSIFLDGRNLQSDNCTIYGNIMEFIFPHCLAYVHCEGYRKIVTVTDSKDKESSVFNWKDDSLQYLSATIFGKIMEFIFPHFSVYAYCEGHRQIV